MSNIRHGGIGVIEEGNLKGRRFIIPSQVLVEKTGLGGTSNYSPACLIHHKFIPSSGCPDCLQEVLAQQHKAKEIGLA